MGSKRNTSFRIPTETFNGDCVHVTIMYVVYSITRRSFDWTVLDVWPAQAFLSRCPVKEKNFGLIWKGSDPKIIKR
jgi:hypothetical protein